MAALEHFHTILKEVQGTDFKNTITAFQQEHFVHIWFWWAMNIFHHKLTWLQRLSTWYLTKIEHSTSWAEHLPTYLAQSTYCTTSHLIICPQSTCLSSNSISRFLLTFKIQLFQYFCDYENQICFYTKQFKTTFSFCFFKRNFHIYIRVVFIW